MFHTTTVNALIYADTDARNWLTVHDCLVSPTKLALMEITFNSEQHKLEFFLRFPQYVRCTQSGT